MIYAVLGAVNLIGFFMMGYDKFKAQNRGWRVPEKSIFLISLIGGAAGVYLGMRAFRHKTKHPSFLIGIPLLISLNALMVYYVGTYVR